MQGKTVSHRLEERVIVFLGLVLCGAIDLQDEEPFHRIVRAKVGDIGRPVPGQLATCRLHGLFPAHQLAVQGAGRVRREFGIAVAAEDVGHCSPNHPVRCNAIELLVAAAGVKVTQVAIDARGDAGKIVSEGSKLFLFLL